MPILLYHRDFWGDWQFITSMELLRYKLYNGSIKTIMIVFMRM